MDAKRILSAQRAVLALGIAGLVFLLGACSTPEDVALAALGKPSTERWTNEHFGPLGPYDCAEHEGAGDVKFVDEWVESGHYTDFFDRHGDLIRSHVKFNAFGTFTDVGSGYQLSYQQAATVFYDYAAGTRTVTGLWTRLLDEDGRVVGRNVGRWTFGPDGLGGSGQLDIDLICPYFPQS